MGRCPEMIGHIVRFGGPDPETWDMPRGRVGRERPVQPRQDPEAEPKHVVRGRDRCLLHLPLIPQPGCGAGGAQQKSKTEQGAFL